MRRLRHEPIPLKPTKWIGTATGVTGADLIELNTGTVATGFLLFLISSMLRSTVGWIHREPSLVVLQGAFTAINLLGIYQWAAF